MLDDMYDFTCSDGSCELLQEYETLLETGVCIFEDQCCEGNQAKANGTATKGSEVRNESVEKILLSIFYSDESMSTKERRRDKNRQCAKEARDADKLYTERMLVELRELVETFGMYFNYITELKRGGICGPESSLEQRCSTHKTNLTLLQASEDDCCTENISMKSTKERNRIHAQKSRRKKNKFWQDMDRERDASFLTLTDVVEYTSALESSCSFLNDFNGLANNFGKLMEIRQRLFDRTCAHQDKYKELSSRLAFRATYKVHFKF
jgi:hypothetical protein